MVEEHGFTFIGPTPEHIRLMGDKVRAKADGGAARHPDRAGLAPRRCATSPTPQRRGARDRLSGAAEGGCRRRRARHEARPRRCRAGADCCRWRRPRRGPAFGDDAVYLERFLDRPRHIEVQLLGDGQGGVIHLGERDCSLQRPHQKVLEETPSPALDPATRDRLCRLAVAALRKLGYKSAGTIEFLYQDGEFYFIEMNTRLQVEHPISEMVSGIDIVREQLRIAAGAPLGYRQSDIALARPRDRMPHQRREPGRISGPRRAGSATITRRAGSACASTARSIRATRCRRTTTA